MITKQQRRNAERIVALDQTLGQLPYNDHGQTPRDVFNLSIPCAHLVVAEVVTGVADTNDGINDAAVADVEDKCRLAVEYTTRLHGRSWWNDLARQLGLEVQS